MSNELDQRDKIGTCFLLVIIIGGAIVAFASFYKPDPWTKGMFPTKELCITEMEFTASSDSDVIILHFTNVGWSPVTVAAVKINDDKITKDSIHGLSSEPGESGTIIIEYDWATGNKYTVNLFTSDGTLAGYYTDTA